MRRVLVLVAVMFVGCGSVDDKGGGGDIEKNPEAMCEASREADQLNAQERGHEGVCHTCYEAAPLATNEPRPCSGHGYWNAREDGAYFQRVVGFMRCEDVPVLVPVNCEE